MNRVGQGHDIHRLADGRSLRLGCVDIPAERGTVAHSDGDALCHALCDAILGAAGLGDMGKYFPSDDPQWKDRDSAYFVGQVTAMLKEAGGSIANVDLTVSIESPRLGPFIEQMRQNLASLLGCQPGQVSVKAKSADGLGPVGAGEAVEARAVALVSFDR